MGNCLISIHVTGSHHNGVAEDIDQIAGQFVDELRRKHNVTAASIVSGGEHDLLSAGQRFSVIQKAMELTETGTPRRIRIDRYTPAEAAIAWALQVVEAAGAHPLLTDAVILLGQAKDRVADFVELPRPAA